MATIGTFHKGEDGNYAGAIKTLTLNVKAAQLRKADKDNDKAPDFRIFSGQTEFGAAWKRLDRDLGRKRWGDEGYAREELVAELGAAFLCADLGLTLQPREDHAAYIANWLEVLQQDKRFIFSAAAYAQRAADYLHGLQSS